MATNKQESIAKTGDPISKREMFGIDIIETLTKDSSVQSKDNG
jgi:hypothetical protein